MTLPSVDVVIPALDEEDHIARCLDAVAAQDYPADRVRIFVVDAGSEDSTADLVRLKALDDARVVLLSDGRKLTTPEALNAGLALGTADIVARVDAHGWPEADFLSRGVQVLEEEGPSVACTGGRAIPAPETPFGRALAIAWTSSFGVGGSVYAAEDGRRDTDTVPWGIYRRQALLEAGGFDAAMNHGEDEELNWRLRVAGRRIVLDTSIRFRYVNRGSWAGAFRQYRNYGAARVRVVAKHPGFLRPYHAAPAALVLALATLASGAPVSRTCRRGLTVVAAAYGSAALLAAVRASAVRDPSLALRVASAFAALHLGYGTGMIEGLTEQRSRPRAAAAV